MGEIMVRTDFGFWDIFAVGLFLFSIWIFNIRIEAETNERPSTYSLMLRFRRQWMDVLVTRQNRITDATILNGLQQSCRFFTSGLIIAIGGIIALMSRPEILNNLQALFGIEYSAEASTAKLLFVTLVLANGLFKFIWSGRIFGYSAIVMAAIPQDDHERAMIEARRASDLNIAASRNFNRGLRMIYFALAALSWLLGVWAFIVAILSVDFIILRREFASHSRNALLEEK